MQLETHVGRRFLVLSSDDNVATLLDEEVEFSQLSNRTAISNNIPFGHKVSIRSIDVGEAVVKYGVKIGVATQPIKKGEHVHVHNCL